MISSIGLPPEQEEEADRAEREGSSALQSALKAFGEGKMSQAERACARVNAIWGTHGVGMAPVAAHLLGRIRIRQGRYAEAARIMAPNLDTNPIMRLDLALCQVKIGQLDEARAAYDPGLITGFNSAFGDVRRYAPDPQNTQQLEAALRWDRAEALRMVGRSDEAVDDLLAARKAFPRNPLLDAELGFHAANTKRHDVSAAAYARVKASGIARFQDLARQGYEVETAKVKAPLDAKRTSGG